MPADRYADDTMGRHYTAWIACDLWNRRMNEWLKWISESTAIHHAVSTVLLISAVAAIRWLALRRLRSVTQAAPDMRRRWMVQIKQASWLLLGLGLLFIWGAELRALALSAVVVTAAIVIATKELIMCISGAILEGSARTFKIGDRIEVAGHRGDVYEQNILTTIILEIGPGQMTHQHTGRTIVLPNSIFLTSPIINETATQNYVMHVFNVPMKITHDWQRIEESLLDAANKECSTFLDDARQHMEVIGREKGLRALTVEPRVTMQIPEPGRVNLVVRIPAPAQRKGRIEQAILRRVMSDLAAVSAEPKENPPSDSGAS